MKKFCTACGVVGYPKLVQPGSTGTAVFLWLVFLLPGIIYSIWRANSEHEVCPSCGSPQVIPVDSPVAQKLMGDDYRKMKEQEAREQADAAAREETERKEQEAARAKLAEEEARRAAQPWIRRNGGTLIAVGAVVLAGVVFWIVGSTVPQTQSSSNDASSSTSSPRPVAAVENWNTVESVNSIDGVKTTLIIDDGIVIRFRGKRLEVYVKTPQMADDSSVRIRFDDGKPSSQTWSRSESYGALFAPDPRGLVAKLQGSRKFYLEYHPYQKVPETLTFDVAGLAVPQDLLATYDKLSQQEHAAAEEARRREREWQRRQDELADAKAQEEQRKEQRKEQEWNEQHPCSAGTVRTATSYGSYCAPITTGR